MWNAEVGMRKVECGEENWEVGTELNSETVKLDFVGNQNSQSY